MSEQCSGGYNLLFQICSIFTVDGAIIQLLKLYDREICHVMTVCITVLGHRVAVAYFSILFLRISMLNLMNTLN